ncbi:hypothetical protein ACFVRB_24080 [Streptomyces nojiriensis]|uniref:hypothetical protein n=1 Tax=Streptomyces nojiriensis TaxID=66374 RepID=UPI0036DD5677
MNPAGEGKDRGAGRARAVPYRGARIRRPDGQVPAAAFASRNLCRFMTGSHPALRDALVRRAGAALHRVGERRWRASGT